MIQKLYKILLISIIALLSIQNVYALDSSSVFRKYEVIYQDGSTNESSSNPDLNYVERLPDQNYKDFTASVVRLILGFTGTLCFISISISGIMFVLAREDSDMQGTAKKILTYSIYGIVTIGLAYSVVYGIARLDLD